MKKKRKSNKLSSKKSAWKTPKLIVLSESEFPVQSSEFSVYAQYGGGGTGVHLTNPSRQASLTQLCD